MGADYRKQHQSILGTQSAVQFAANLTRYLNPGGGPFNLVEAEGRMRFPYTCTIRNLYVRVNVAPGAGETFIYTIMLNGAPTAITATIADLNTEADDLVNIIAVALGGEICLRVVSSLNAAAANHSLSLEVDR